MKSCFIRTLGTVPQTPAAVQGLTAAVVSSSEIDLTWIPIAGAENYTVRIAGNPVSTQPLPGVNFTTLMPATTYSFTVAAINSFGEGPQSAPVTATTRPALQPPGQVMNLAGTVVSSNAINLTWSVVATASNYIVNRNGVAIATSTSPAYSDTGLTAGTAYTYTVTATNNAGPGPASAPAVLVTTAALNPSGVKLHAITQGGFYGYSDATSYAGTLSATTAFLKRTDIQNIAGVQVYFRVGEMEATQGNYTQLFADVDNLITLCRAAGKRLAFGVWERGFGPSDGTSNGMSPPAYMKGGTAATGAPAGSNSYTCWAAQGASFGGVDSILNYGSTTCLNDIIAMYQAIGDRYNGNPTVECFIWFGETAFSPAANTPSAAAFNSAILQIAKAIAPHWQNTLIRLEANFIPGGSNANMAGWLALYDTLPNFVAGGPDPVTTPPLTGFTTNANSDFTGNSLGPDRRGSNPWWSECQTNGLGGANKLFPGGSGTGAALGSSTALAMINAQIAAGAYYFTVNFNDNTDTVQFNRDMLPIINSLSGRLQSSVPTAGVWNQA